MYVERIQQRTYAQNVSMREEDGCVKTVPRLTSVERKYFYRFAIHHGWGSVAIAEVIFIRISLFRIQRKKYDSRYDFIMLGVV